MWRCGTALFVHADTPQDAREKIIAVAQKTMMSERAQKLAAETGALIYWQTADDVPRRSKKTLRPWAASKVCCPNNQAALRRATLSARRNGRSFGGDPCRASKRCKPCSNDTAAPGDIVFAWVLLIISVFLLSQLFEQTAYKPRGKLFAQPRFWPAVSLIRHGRVLRHFTCLAQRLVRTDRGTLARGLDLDCRAGICGLVHRICRACSLGGVSADNAWFLRWL